MGRSHLSALARQRRCKRPIPKFRALHSISRSRARLHPFCLNWHFGWNPTIRSPHFHLAASDASLQAGLWVHSGPIHHMTVTN